MSKELEILAADPATKPQRLRELAANHPSLRPIIAMNPAAYPSLLQWLAGLGDPAVNVALQQRLAAERAQEAANLGSAPQRVSVLQRAEGSPTTAAPETGSTSINPSGSGEVRGLPSCPGIQTGVQTGTQPVVQPTVALDLPPRRNKAVIAWIVSGVAVVVAAVAIFLVVSLIRERDQNMAATSSQNSAGQSPGTAEGEGEGATNQESELELEDEAEVDSLPEILYPAPESALLLAHVVAPSGNISCLMGLDGVTCTINTYSFTDPSLSSCGTNPATFTDDGEEIKVSCSVPPVRSQGAVTLAYGDFATNALGACHSTEQGMICWNTATGSGFAVSREGYVTGTDGLILRSSLPWS